MTEIIHSMIQMCLLISQGLNVAKYCFINNVVVKEGLERCFRDSQYLLFLQKVEFGFQPPQGSSQISITPVLGASTA
ncbi:hypothetical protein ACQP3L_36550, partial [Escherichia coli]